MEVMHQQQTYWNFGSDVHIRANQKSAAAKLISGSVKRLS